VEQPAKVMREDGGDHPLRPAFHSITSSAMASTVGGISRPSALAVLRLITNRYFVGACTGRSEGTPNCAPPHDCEPGGSELGV
jgi:hypothetical protein